MGSLKDVICGSFRDLYHCVDGELASNNTRNCKAKYLWTSSILIDFYLLCILHPSLLFLNSLWYDVVLLQLSVLTTVPCRCLKQSCFLTVFNCPKQHRYLRNIHMMTSILRHGCRTEISLNNCNGPMPFPFYFR